MAQNQKSYDIEVKAQAVKLAQEIGGAYKRFCKTKIKRCFISCQIQRKDHGRGSFV